MFDSVQCRRNSCKIYMSNEGMVSLLWYSTLYECLTVFSAEETLTIYIYMSNEDMVSLLCFIQVFLLAPILLMPKGVLSVL